MARKRLVLLRSLPPQAAGNKDNVVPVHSSGGSPTKIQLLISEKVEQPSDLQYRIFVEEPQR